MDIANFRTLKAILETGTFQNAANKLGYTQSTISFQIRQLEQLLDFPLFEKVGRRMVFTQAGRDILPFVDTLLDSYQQILDYGQTAQTLAGALHVAMPESLMVYKMQPVLAAFHQQAPGVELALHSYSCFTINNYVVTGEVDIGLQYDIEGTTGNVVTQDVEELSLVMVGPSEFRGKAFAEVAATSPFIVSNDAGDAHRVIAQDYMQQSGIRPRAVMELGSTEAIKRSVVNSLGISYLPRFSVVEELAAGTLAELSCDITGMVVTVICVIHKNKWVNPAMQLFIDLLKARAQE
ncbi:LysR family transcriptional regulator [Ruminococcaceae bacterium OttesenSCG-928-O06]|nr:LysR family transcriptional regulator [Ruminococcaceae bacterium OttesenSCG-928-O06]